MRNKLILISLITLAGLGIFLVMANSTTPNLPQPQPSSSSSCPTEGKVEVIEMTEETFNPPSLTIQKCTKVTFKNLTTTSRWPASNLHPTHGIYPEFDPQQGIFPQAEWQFIFDKAGKWRYHDHLFPSLTGEIIVNE